MMMMVNKQHLGGGRMLTELVFICAQSTEPFPIILLDPVSGSSKWSFRRNTADIQPESAIECAEPLGQSPSMMCIALAGKPLLFTVPLICGKRQQQQQHSSPFSAPVVTKSVLNCNAKYLASHPCGDFLFVAAENKLFTWEVRSGQLLSMLEHHIRDISVLRTSSCGDFLATASLDGAVKIYLSANLIAEPDNTVIDRIEPIAGHKEHSLAVNDLSITPGPNPRILSVSADHSACLYSLSAKQALLKITASDQPLSACCVDPAQTRLFFGSEKGTIRMVDLTLSQIKNNSTFRMHQNHRRKEEGKEKEENCGGEKQPNACSSTAAIVGPFEQQHNGAIVQMCVNSDGTRLASGDRNGLYCIWDIPGGQCLQSGKMGGAIRVIFFVSPCSTFSMVQQENGTGFRRPGERVLAVPYAAQSLQRQMPAQRKLTMAKHSETGRSQDEKGMRELFDSLLRSLNANGAIGAAVTENELGNNFKSPSAFGGRKRRRFSAPSTAEESSSNITSAAQQREQPAEENGDDDQPPPASAEQCESLRNRIGELERELARLAHINDELYSFATNLSIDEDNGCG